MIRRCIEAGCTERQDATRCVRHKREFDARRRQDPTVTGARGSSPQWKRLRLEALVRDGFTCQNCGSRPPRTSKYSLHVHHVNEDANDNRLANLKTLCNDCHQEEHAA